MGGPSREREVSFAGGRTVYDNLDKRLFDPVPIFVDSLGTPILLNWQYIYKGTIRDFFPPTDALPKLKEPVQLYLEHLDPLAPEEYERCIRSVGQRLRWDSVKALVDFAFLTLHGTMGEDGGVQGLLESLGIPYSGCGILGSAIGMDKRTLRRMLPGLGFTSPTSVELTVATALADPAAALTQVKQQVGFPCVVKHPTQGSSIGVQVVQRPDDFAATLQRVAFLHTIQPSVWQAQAPEQRSQFVQKLTDLREPLCLPLVAIRDGQTRLIRRPDHLLNLLDRATSPVLLSAPDAPQTVLVERFIKGQEFSVIVVEDEQGNPLALPPTQIVKAQDVYDYRSKYLPGLARKITPMELPDEQVRHICAEAERLMHALFFSVYARIDGILAQGGPDGGTVYFNDPNTTSGMLPGSFFFHQASEIGLNPTQFLTYVVQASLAARQREGRLRMVAADVQSRLLTKLAEQAAQQDSRRRVGVFLGGYGTERHVAVESGRNVYEKLSSTAEVAPAPIFVLHNQRLRPDQRQQLGIPDKQPFSFWALPINVLLKDNADDIADKIVHSIDDPAPHPVVRDIAQRAAGFVSRLAGHTLTKPLYLPWDALREHMDFAFVTVHGRPGEDGQLQRVLEAAGLPYNGSGVASSSLTINKYETNSRLAAAGLRIPGHYLLQKAQWQFNPDQALSVLEHAVSYPLIAKPADEGCSSAVKKINNRAELQAYAAAAFRAVGDALPTSSVHALRLTTTEEFPAKDTVLVEELVQAGEGARLLEVTVGVMTTTENGQRSYHVLEPSETLAAGAVLTLEEKFLAGEGQNITPARFSPDVHAQARISAAVREEIGKAAQLLNIEGYARIDAFVRIRPVGATEEVEVVFIEVNSLPALTPATCIFHQSAIAGYSPVQFLQAIIKEGQQRAPVAV